MKSRGRPTGQVVMVLTTSSVEDEESTLKKMTEIKSDFVDVTTAFPNVLVEKRAFDNVDVAVSNEEKSSEGEKVTKLMNFQQEYLRSWWPRPWTTFARISGDTFGICDMI